MSDLIQNFIKDQYEKRMADAEIIGSLSALVDLTIQQFETQRYSNEAFLQILKLEYEKIKLKIGEEKNK